VSNGSSTAAFRTRPNPLWGFQLSSAFSRALHPILRRRDEESGKRGDGQQCNAFHSKLLSGWVASSGASADRLQAGSRLEIGPGHEDTDPATPERYLPQRQSDPHLQSMQVQLGLQGSFRSVWLVMSCLLCFVFPGGPDRGQVAS